MKIKAKAAEALRLQNDIVGDFMSSHQTGKPQSTAPKPKPKRHGKLIPSKMVNIEALMGKFGPRYFIKFEVNGMTKYFQDAALIDFL